MFDDLRSFVEALDSIGKLRRIDGADWDLEVGAICELMAERIESPLLFDKVKDYPEGYRIVANLLQTPIAQKLALGIPEHLSDLEVIRYWKDKFNKYEPVPPVEVGSGPIMENVFTGDGIDILKFPTPKWHEKDGGRYIGTGVSTITRCSDEGWVNIGTYRVMIQDAKTLSFYVSPGQHASIMRERYWAKGEDCPVVMCFGQDPLLYGISVMPLPWGMSEYDFAGYIKGSPIEVIKGKATIAAAMMVEITAEQGQKQSLQAKRIILATGSKPMVLPVPGADSTSGIINAESILNLESIPESLLMIGGGVIGVEMGTILARLGCKVTIVEMMPHILPIEDAEVTAILARALKDDGLQIHEGTKVSRIDDANGKKLVTISNDDSEQKLEAEVVAIGVGYKPNIDGLGLEEAGVVFNKGGIQVNEHVETSVPNIYAAGDAIGGLMLAYVAMEEGVVAAENAMGKSSTIDYQAVPRCTFTLPELASVGLTEEEAITQGYEIQIGRFPFAANSMATILGERRGLVKIISDKKYGQIVGVHIIGPQATELITEVTLAMKLDATPQELITTIHAHPSLSEAIREAALDITGAAIHAMPRNK